MVEQTSIDKVCKQYNTKYFAVSAKTGVNVTSFFEDVALDGEKQEPQT